MKCSLSALIVLFIAGGLLAQQEEPKPESSEPVKSEKAIEILKKADEAIKKVKAVEYDAKVIGTGAAADRAGEARGHVVLAGEFVGRSPSKHVTQVEIKPPDSQEVRKFTVGTDNDTFFLIDPAEKTVYEDIDPAVLGRRGDIARVVWMIEYVHATPFNDELDGRVVEFKGTTEVAGEDCYEIRVHYSTSDQWATWFFSTKDYLPRRVLREYPQPDGQVAGRDLILSNVAADPKLGEDAFTAKVPEGFKKTDEFAPDDV